MRQRDLEKLGGFAGKPVLKGRGFSRADKKLSEKGPYSLLKKLGNHCYAGGHDFSRGGKFFKFVIPSRPQPRLRGEDVRGICGFRVFQHSV